MYGRLFGSTTTLTPWLSNSWSSGFTASTNSSLYAMPEQPEVRTPRRRPTPLPRLARKLCTWLAAFSVSVIAMLLRLARSARVLFLVVLDRRLDRVLGEDRAVDLDRRQRQLLRDLGVLDGRRLVERLALDPLGDQRARGDGRAAAVGLEARVLDAAVGADLDLQLHHVAAGGCADHAGAYRLVAFFEGTDVARVLVMVDDLIAVCHVRSSVCCPLDGVQIDAVLVHFPERGELP